jgi:signal transduction histidine kinase
VAERIVLSALTGSRAFLQKLTALLELSEPQAMASEALSILITDFGATAGSLFYVSRQRFRVRLGAPSEALSAHIAQWEANIEQRIVAGPWRIAKDESASLASRPVPGTGREGTGQAVIYSLIASEDTVAGSICLAYPVKHIPTGEQRRLLAAFLRAVGSLICLASEYAFTKERLSQLTLFYQVAQSMASTFEVSKVLGDTMQLATAVLDAGVSALMLVDEKTDELVFEYTHGDRGNVLRKERIPIDEGIAGWVAKHGVPLIVNDVHSDTRFNSQVDARTGFLTQSVVCAPIQIRGQTIGVLEALNKRSGLGFDSEDLSLIITTANQAAIAIESARLYQNLRDERDRIIKAQENVRRQVARNLHDGTVQYLAAISMGIDHLERLLELKPEVAKSELEALRNLTQQATRQARLALFELRPLVLESQGLVAALEAYVEQLQGGEEFGVHFEASDPLPELDEAVAATVFAIVQEAVTNAKKHASPRDVWLRLSGEDGWLQVVIEDNGAGFDPEAVNQGYDKRGSIGLLTMRERADLIDGHLAIESNRVAPRPGTKVTLRVPSTKSAGQT